MRLSFTKAEPYLFYIIAVLMVLPFWLHPYLYTTDGTAHLATSKLLLDKLLGRCPEITALVEVNPALPPNWLGHILMMVLMGAGIPPLIVEKMMMSLCAAGWPLATRVLCAAIDKDARWLAWLGLPLGYGYFVLSGGFNFSLSSILAILFVAYWIRGNAQIAVVTVWMAGIYFAHPMGLALAGVLVGCVLLSQVVSQPRALYFLWRQGMVFIPGALLCGGLLYYYASHAIPPKTIVPYDFYQQLAYAPMLLLQWMMLGYLRMPMSWLTLPFTVFGVFLTTVLLVQSPRSRRGLGWIAALAVFLLAAMLLPNQWLGGWGVGGRMMLVAVVAWLAWLACHAPGAPQSLRWLTLLVSVGTMAVIAGRYQQEAAQVSAIIARVAPPRDLFKEPSRLLTLNLTPSGRLFHEGEALELAPVNHLGQWLTVERCILDYNNYSLDNLSQFPLNLRQENRMTPVWNSFVTIEVMDIYDFAFPYGDLDVTGLPDAGRPDYVVLWGDASQVTRASVSERDFKGYVEYPAFRARLDAALGKLYEPMYRAPPPYEDLLVVYRKRSLPP